MAILPVMRRDVRLALVAAQFIDNAIELGVLDMFTVDQLHRVTKNFYRFVSGAEPEWYVTWSSDTTKDKVKKKTKKKVPKKRKK